MRRLIAFPCAGAALAGSLDESAGATGVLLVIGGSQTRIGSHRMYERLAKSLAEKGYPCFRFDRRGVGDSEGEDPGFKGSEADLLAAAAAFRNECPALTRLIGFGLCDGATALVLFGDAAGLDGLILANPWLVETEAGEPPPAAIRQHYRKRLLSKAGWKKSNGGSRLQEALERNPQHLLAPKEQSLAQDVLKAMLRHRLPPRRYYAWATPPRSLPRRR